jgi:flavin reductase ActVB
MQQHPTGGAEPVAEDFVRAMSRLPAGVVMVTTRSQGRPWGLTVSTCCSVSVTPCLLLVSVTSSTVTAAPIHRDGVFGVSVLGHNVLHTARYGGAPGAPKFLEAFCDETARSPAPCTTPAVAGALAHLDCRVVRDVEAGDHTIFIGEVERVRLGRLDDSLVYCSRTYFRLDRELDVGQAVEATDLASLYPPW